MILLVPGTHMNSDSESVREHLLRGPDINVPRGGGRGGVEVGVVGGQLATEGIHAPGDLTRLLVAPADRCKIGLVVHEATVEGGIGVGIGRADMDLVKKPY